MSEPDANPSTILLVDDETELLSALHTLLSAAGYRTLTANDAEEALAFLERETVDVVVSDIVMPGASGVDLLARARELAFGAEFVLMSGMPTVETARHAVRLGASEYLVKPFRAPVLVQAVRRALQTKQDREESERRERAGQKTIERLSEDVRKRTRELEQSTGRYRELVESLEIAAFEISLESGQLTYLNGRLARSLWGDSLERPWSIDLANAVVESDRPTFRQILKGAEQKARATIELQTTAGAPSVFVDCHISDSARSSDRTAGVLVDVTDRVRAERSKEQAMAELESARDQLRRRLVAGLADTKERSAVRVATPSTPSGKDRMVFGHSPAMTELRHLGELAANHHEPILLNGETGSGKGMLAEWLHARSPRASGNFVAINCASLRGDLISAELFGHAKGAFTSADRQRRGLIEEAHGGTLFLDEIGELDPETQARLLKVLEDKAYRRVGETRERQSDFRLISATHRNLEAMAQEGRFRRDLLYRINLFTLTIPPLREHTEDLHELVRHLAASVTGESIDFPEDTLRRLAMHSWPGNVRELRNVLIRSLLLSGGAPPRPEHLALAPLQESSPSSLAPASAISSRPAPFAGRATSTAPPEASSGVRHDPPNAASPGNEYDEITDLMKRFDGNKAKVARALGISRTTLYRRLAEAEERSS